MEQPFAALGNRLGQPAGSGGVDRKRQIGLILGSIDRGVGGGVDRQLGCQFIEGSLDALAAE